jgi:hypothetical protein
LGALGSSLDRDMNPQPVLLHPDPSTEKDGGDEFYDESSAHNRVFMPSLTGRSRAQGFDSFTA